VGVEEMKATHQAQLRASMRLSDLQQGNLCKLGRSALSVNSPPNRRLSELQRSVLFVAKDHLLAIGLAPLGATCQTRFVIQQDAPSGAESL
jgi:hypothetical protein